MDVSGLSGLFQSNRIFQPENLLGQKLVQSPVNDTLHRLSENLLNAKTQANDLKTRFDTLELSAEATEGKGKTSLDEMPEGLLRFYLNQCKVGACLSQQHEASLMEYRNQLSAFDQTIQEYQDMLDGNKALPKQMKLDDISKLLDATKAMREQFMQQGAAELNQISNHNPTQEGYMGKAFSMVTEWVENGSSDTCWQIDVSANDIYGEIDRALSSAHNITSTFQKGASNILSELKRRGCVEDGEIIPYDNQGAESSESVQRESLFQSIYDEIWSVFQRSINE